MLVCVTEYQISEHSEHCYAFNIISLSEKQCLQHFYVNVKI